MYDGIFGAAREHARTSAAIMAGHRASEQAMDAKTEVNALKFEVERLLMISEALWGILKEQLGYDEEELIRRIEEIDMRDGKIDGKVANQPPEPCPFCGRKLIGKRPLCLYCGEHIPRDPFKR